MEVSIEIETSDNTLGSDLFGTRSLSRGLEKEIADGATIRFESTRIREAIGLPDIIQITLNFVSSFAASYLANWLYAKLNGKATKIRINRLEIEIDRGKIEKVLREKIEIK